MQITREELNPCTIQLKVVCAPDEVRAGFDRALKNLAKRVRIPGFRPGHAPKALVEQSVDKRALYEEAMEQVVGASFRAALKQENLEPDPTVRPQINLTKFLEAECEYTAKVGLRPIVNLAPLENLQAERPSATVTDEDVERFLEDIRRRHSTREPVTSRGVEEGDVAVVNIRPEGSEESRTFMTIAGQTFPQLDEALKGMRVEEVKQLELAFPANFQEKDWAGKTMKVTVMLNSLSAVKLPELDDQFAQSFATSNVEELRSRIKEGLTRASQEAAQNIVADSILDDLLARSEVHVSDNLWEPVAEQRMEEIEAEQRKRGATLEQYAKERGLTVEELRESYRDKARTEVMRAIVIREVYRTQGMKVDAEDLERALGEMASEADVEPKEMIRHLEQHGALNEVQFRAIAQKVRDFLVSKADVREAVGAR